MKLAINNFSLNLCSLLSFLVFCSVMELFNTQGQHKKFIKKSPLQEFIHKYNQRKINILEDKHQNDQISIEYSKRVQGSDINHYGDDFSFDKSTNKFQTTNFHNINGFKNAQQTQKPQELLVSQKQQKYHYNNRILLASIPAQFDWRNFTTITDVKDQGFCGAGYAFSVAAFFQQDSILSGLSNSSINLSEMFLMTCNIENNFCNSGNVESGFDNIINRGSFPLQTQYPFDPSNSILQSVCLLTDFFKISNYTKKSYYNVQDPQTIKQIIYKKPVVTSICGIDLAFYSPTNSSRTLRCNPLNRVIDHSALLIGYTDTQWIIKNSWGKNWGIDGYAYISRNPAEDCCIGNQLFTTGSSLLNCSVQYCQSCVEIDSCSSCQSGRYVFTNSTTATETCQLCTESNCKECYNYLGTCKWCADGYALNKITGKCTSTSIVGCNRLESGLCTQCKPGYRVTSSKTSCNASCTVRNCIDCSSGACSNCSPGFNLSTGIVNGSNVQICTLYSCVMANCTLCNSTGNCIQCKSGFLLNTTSGTCYTNCTIAGCINCYSGSTTCNECVEGKSWNSSKKVCEVFSGTSNCKIHKTTCTTCKSGYTLSKTKMCLQNCQNSFCSTCLVADMYTCLTCATGYYLYSTQYYAYCNTNPCNVTNCSLCDSNGSCLACSTAFLVYNSSSNQCQNQCKLTNCRDCLPTATSCSFCNPGYSISYYTGLCISSNFPNCLMIDQLLGYWSCSQCDVNYYMTSDYMNCYIYCTDYYCEYCDDNILYACTKCFDGYYPYFINGTRTCQFIYPTMTGCDYISYNQSYCFECNYYYLQNTTTGSCDLNTVGCPSYCEYCTPSGYLFECKCKNNLAFEYYSEKCITQPMNDSNCFIVSLISGKYYCRQCLNGMLVNAASKGCEPACMVNNCTLCEVGFNKYCVTCNLGFYIDAGATICTQCAVSNCAACTSSICLACQSGYRLSSNGQSCEIVNCASGFLFDGYECICPLETFYTLFTCQSCIQTNCQQCNSVQCYVCQDGYFLQNNTCQNCQINCKKCISDTLCIVCMDGYIYDTQQSLCINIADQGGSLYYVTNTTVVQCPISCTQCTNQGICQQCTVGYSVVNGTCLSCQSYCKTCSPSNLSLCLTCQNGYNLINGSCTKCNDIYCLNCDFTTNLCTECKQGYYLYGGICKACTEQNCLKCNYFGQCTKCDSGYTLMSDFTCVQCGGNCRSCNPNSINQCYITCNSSSYLSNNQCYQCPQNCKSCISASTCTTCRQGYVLRNGTCSKICSEGCYECNQTLSQVCFKCISGYTLTNDGNCSINIGCNADNNCTVCPVNFALINGACQACSTTVNCTQCSSTNLSLCLQCKNGFYLSNGNCLQCNQTCLTCSQPDRCQSCRDGFYLPIDMVFGNCSKCDPMCLTCVDNSTKCLTCKSGYELSVTDKCLRVQRIDCQLLLDLVIENFPNLSREIRNALVALLGAVSDYRYYIITGLQSGSTILSYSLSVPDGMDPYTVYDNYQLGLSGMNQLASVNVISINSVTLYDPYVVAVNNTTNTSTTTNTTTDNNTTTPTNTTNSTDTTNNTSDNGTTTNNTTVDNTTTNANTTTNNTVTDNTTSTNTTNNNSTVDNNTTSNNNTNNTNDSNNNNTSTNNTTNDATNSTTNNNTTNNNNQNNSTNNQNNSTNDQNNSIINQNDTLNSYTVPATQSSSSSKLPIIIGIVIPVVIILLGTAVYLIRKKLIKKNVVENQSELALQQEKLKQTQHIKVKSKLKPIINTPHKQLDDSVASFSPMKTQIYNSKNKQLNETKDFNSTSRQPDSYSNNRYNNTTFFNSTGFPQESIQSRLEDPSMANKLEMTSSFDTTLQNIVNQLNEGNKNNHNKIGLHQIIDQFDEEISEIHGSKAILKPILNLVTEDQQELKDIELVANDSKRVLISQENNQTNPAKTNDRYKTFYGFKPNFTHNNNLMGESQEKESLQEQKQIKQDHPLDNIKDQTQKIQDKMPWKQSKEEEFSIEDGSKADHGILVQREEPIMNSTPQVVSNLHIIEQGADNEQPVVPQFVEEVQQPIIKVAQFPQVPKPITQNNHLQIIDYGEDQDDIEQSQF